MIGAVVVTYNAPAATVTGCLRSLHDAGGVDCCVLVDTVGRADLGSELRDLAPFVEVITVSNRGYGAAVNVGWRRLRERGADHVAVLNDDVVVRAGWIESLLVALRGRVGVAQPVIVASASGPDVVNSLGVEFDRYGAGIDVGRGDPPPPADAATPLETFTGGAFVATAEFLASTGGFDERWFLYYEDADLAARGREIGWEYRLVAGAIVEHVGGASTSADTDRTRYLQERNRIWFAARHLRPSTMPPAVWMSVRRLRHPPRAVHLRALVAGSAGVPARLFERLRARRAIRNARVDGPSPTRHGRDD